jgi:hypothetical protein
MSRGARLPRRDALGFVAAALAAAAAGCAKETLGTPPRAPSLDRPADALPPDLDAVLRLDLGRVRSALGPAGVAAIKGLADRPVEPGRERAPEATVTDALEHADVVLVGLRTEIASAGPDTVIVLEGRFPARALAPRAWGNPVDLGGDVRRWDRPSPGERSSPARLYAFGDRRLVIASELEVDAVEAVLERGLAPNALSAPERGLFAFAAKLRRVKDRLVAKAPLFAEALRSAKRIEGSVEPSAAGLTLDVTLELDGPESAERAAELFERARVASASGRGSDESPGAVFARTMTIGAAGQSVTVRCSLPSAVVLALLQNYTR